jgi:hypothetical protein
LRSAARHALALSFAVVVAALAAQTAPARPISTAVFDPGAFVSANQGRAFDRVRATGARMVRLTLYWNDIAPAPVPALYNWGWFDREVNAAVARGLVPFVEVMRAPVWATGNRIDLAGTYRPDPVAFGQFAEAAAARYSGRTPGLPRIRYWQAWGEPNRDYFFKPQFEGGRLVSGSHYRAMVQHFARGVKSVDPSNVVIAGGLSPIGRNGNPAPLAFMRDMLCLNASLRRSCDLRSSPVPFDAWSHHAYTEGGPTHRAAGRDNVSLGDLGDLKRVLRAARRAGHVHAPRGVGFWVTEFGWDSNPPDPRAISASLHARWTSEAIYRMWAAGVTVATWWKIEDEPMHASRYQSGFFGTDGGAKHSLTAFRFPVVAFRRSGRVYVWGRTPVGSPGRVTVQIRAGGGWRRLATVRANAHGIFGRTLRTSARKGFVRARFAGEVSLPFSLTPVRDRRVEPFGSP